MGEFGQTKSRGRAGSAAARVLRAAPLATAIVLAGCGGGSSGGGVPPPPPVVQCTATDGGGTGFALGVCADLITAAFQPVEATVVPGPASEYAIALTAPATLPQVVLTTANRTPVGTRDIIGELRGEAYEADSDASNLTLLPPYVALIDFHRAWHHSESTQTDSPTVPLLQFASFGVWEHFAKSSFADGYLGSWYAARPASDGSDLRPTLTRNYSGVAVGVLTPAVPGGGGYSQSYGFSATVTLQADNNGIQSGEISGMKISYGPPDALVVEPVALKTLAISNPINLSPPSTASLVSSTGTGADASGTLEARFFGSGATPADQGREIAGRFRFQTSDGKLFGVGAFGVRAP